MTTDYKALIDQVKASTGRGYIVPWQLVQAMIDVSSGGDPNYLNSAGGAGLMAVSSEPPPYGYVGATKATGLPGNPPPKLNSVADLYKPATNINWGLYLLDDAITQFANKSGYPPVSYPKDSWPFVLFIDRGGALPPTWSGTDFKKSKLASAALSASKYYRGVWDWVLKVLDRWDQIVEEERRKKELVDFVSLDTTPGLDIIPIDDGGSGGDFDYLPYDQDGGGDGGVIHFDQDGGGENGDGLTFTKRGGPFRVVDQEGGIPWWVWASAAAAVVIVAWPKKKKKKRRKRRRARK